MEIMTAVTTLKIKEQYRIIPSQNFYGFPKGVCTAHLSMIGYFQGIRINTKTKVDISMFDSISFLCWSVNDNNTKQKFIHALGVRVEKKVLNSKKLNQHGTETVLVLEYFKQKPLIKEINRSYHKMSRL